MSDRANRVSRPAPYWVRFRAHYYLARRIQRQSPWQALATAFAASRARHYGRSTRKPSEALVRIAADGTLWELTDAEKAYVDKDFSPFDGARPNIKSKYQDRTALGDISGFIDRDKAPPGMPVSPASKPS